MNIRLADSCDIPRVMEFIKENWSEKHILANKREFMEYQHCTPNGEFTYVLAEEDGKIYGVEGYIPMNNEEQPDIAGALWKVIPSNYFMLGKAIRESLIKLTNCRYMCSPGINMNTSGKVLGMYGQHVQKMEHYYRLAELKEYKIAVINEKKNQHDLLSKQCRLEKITDFEEMSRELPDDYLRTKVPYKDKNYLKHRYFEHPYYHYDVYKIVGEKKSSFIILREVLVNDVKMGKIIDFIGEDEHLRGLSDAWDTLMKEKGYEFIDFYCYGIEQEILESSGFIKREEDDKNIIPNYFEPFSQQNVDIYFVSNVLEKLHLYRGDGDQDRPSFY